MNPPNHINQPGQREAQETGIGHRTLQDIEANARACVCAFEEGVSPILERIAPILSQTFYDFAHLKKGQLIMNCATQDEWSRTYFKRTARALRYMFEGGNAAQMRQRRSIKPTVELPVESGRKTFSVLPESVCEVVPVESEPAVLLLEGSSIKPQLPEPAPAMCLNCESLRRLLQRERAQVVTLKGQIDSLLSDIPEAVFVPVEALRDRWRELAELKKLTAAKS